MGPGDRVLWVETVAGTWVLAPAPADPTGRPGLLATALTAALEGSGPLRDLGAVRTPRRLTADPSLTVNLDRTTFQLVRPAPCPHEPPPVASCVHPAPTVAHAHRAPCGCWCSGMLRWHHPPATALAHSLAPVAVRLLARLFNRPWVREPWSWWSRFEHRAATHPVHALALWAELADVNTVGAAAEDNATALDAIAQVITSDRR